MIMKIFQHLQYVTHSSTSS